MLNTSGEPLPLLHHMNAILFPGRSLSMRIRRKLSRRAVEQAKFNNSKVLFVLARTDQNVKPEDISSVGTLATVVEQRGQNIVLSGVERVRLGEIKLTDGYLSATWVAEPDDYDCSEESLTLLVSQIKRLSLEILTLIPSDTQKLRTHIESLEDPSMLMHLIAENLESSIMDKQMILETRSIKDRALLVLDRMQKALDSLKLQAEVRTRISSKMSKEHRENILREHMRAIQDELGDADGLSKLRSKVLLLPEKNRVREIALEELGKLVSMGKFSPEASLTRNYIETLVSLPWAKAAPTEIDLARAKATLDHDHFGLKKVKDRILEYLAVLKLRQGSLGSIILLVGPPGVGKTSLGKSIAQALGRPFVRASLGGVRDDAEIRGHRRTYIGSLPGQIINGMKRAQASNPVFLLDEIDKLSYGPHGDPAAALLEVLDPEQNSTFVDHYVDLPFDLSDTLFVCTANQVSGIPQPLLDRLEVIDLSSYTLEEKIQIALNYLLPKAIRDHGLAADSMPLNQAILSTIIQKFTREAGVRELSRRIAALARHAALARVNGDANITYDEALLHRVLGREVHDPTESADTLSPGVATGLAWTPFGGDILFIETRQMPGSGKVILTGRLGDVMKESAQIALSLIRSLLPGLINDTQKVDFHIHVPSGATPKDGPSAGIALVAALASLVTRTPLASKTAMSGEVSLSGKVMPVGGIKEKLIAAHAAGIQTVFLSSKNKRDLDDLPAVVIKELDVVFIDDVAELLRKLLNYQLPHEFYGEPQVSLIQ